MEPQLFALVNADDHDAIYCYGVDTGEEAFTFRRDPDTRKTLTGIWSSMDSAFSRTSRMVGEYASLELLVYESEVAEVIRPTGG